jgi:hypothetical protein
MPNARHALLRSAHGHDGFLIESGELAGMIAAFRRSLHKRRAPRAERPACLSAVAE